MEYNAGHYGVLSYLEHRDGKIDAKESSRLHGLLEGQRGRLSRNEVADIKEVLKPLVAQVLINDLIRKSLSIPFLDWDDAQDFYEQLEASRWEAPEESLTEPSVVSDAARRLFEVVIPELRPRSIREVVKFIRNRKAVRSLRSELWELLDGGDSVSEKWMLSLQAEAMRAQLRAGTRARVIKWVGRIVSLIPGIGTVGGITLKVVEDTVHSATSRSVKDRFEWYYALQRLRLSDA